MRQKALIIIQNLSKSGSPLTFLHVIDVLKESFDIEVAVARVNDPDIDLEYLDEYKANTKSIITFNIKSYTLFNRAFPLLAYRPLLKVANNSKYAFVMTNIFEVGALLIKNHIRPKVFFYSLDKLELNSKYSFVNKRKRRMFNYLAKADCFIALTSTCFYDWFDYSNNNNELLLDYPDIDLKLTSKRFHRGTINLGTIGYFCEKKNQLYSLQLLKNMIDMKLNVHLYLMGFYFDNDKVYYEKMINFINQNNLTSCVHFCDKNYDKIAYFDGIDVLLCPSLFEGLGLVILEAQFRKTPCVVSDVLPRESQLGLVTYCPLQNNSIWIKSIQDAISNEQSVVIKDLKTEFCDKLKFIIEKYS